MAQVRGIAYGVLKLKPAELDELSLLDFEDMYDAYEMAHTNRLWEMAYWVSNMISVHTKRGVKADRLMKPFIKPKSTTQKASEAEEFFAEFQAERNAWEKQRKGLADGEQ